MSVPSGYFSKIDSVHVHVDGGGESAPVEFIVNQLKEQGCEGKTTPISNFVAGPQRREDWAISTYESHTPGPGSQEHLEFFSTSLLSADLRDMNVAIQRLNSALTMLFDQQAQLPEGIVVEAERVIAQGDENIKWSDIPIDESLTIRSPDVGFQRSRTADIEIHYAFDIAKEGKWVDKPPITLKELRTTCDQLGIFVGGWFFFDKGDKWAYRSNQFARIAVKQRVQEQRDKLHEYLIRKGKELEFDCKVRALIEQILGVWRTPLQVVDQEIRKSPRQLAEWESSRELEEFWVIAPNFLGDTRGDVRRAMIHNLRNRVCYTYFLRSFADVQRLRRLTAMLKPDIEEFGDIFDLMRAVVLESGEFERDFFRGGEYFIAYSNQDNRDGYRLLRTEKGLVTGGQRMTTADFRKADQLRNVLQQSQVSHWMKIPLRRDFERPKQKGVVCVYLNIPSRQRTTHTDFEPEATSDEFDQMLADNVSKLHGEVVKGSSSSYFIIFDTAEAALTCASRLQICVRQYNQRLLNPFQLVRPRISVDFGLVKRVLRSYGFDVLGHPVLVSDKLIEQVDDGRILLTKAVEDNIPNSSKTQFKFVKPTIMAIEEFGSVECRTLDWE
jgi:hypothetical protein